MDYEQKLIEFLLEKNLRYVHIKNEESLPKIFHLFVNNTTYEALNDDEYFYLGVYYCVIEKNYPQTIKCYLKAIEHKNSYAMCCLGHYYYNVEKNYELMEKYYLMAIDFGNNVAMTNLGYYYADIEKNNELMKKYYLMAIDFGNIVAMQNLGYYYQNTEKNYELMKKYYLMAIDQGSKIALRRYCDYLIAHDKIVKSYKLNIKYKHLISRKVLVDNINKLWCHKIFRQKDKKFLLEVMSTFEFNSEDDVAPSLLLFSEVVNSKIDIMDLHFDYSMEGKGFIDAKNDFFDRIANK
jgi:tetratricopeptide (TPR) repeat protein